MVDAGRLLAELKRLRNRLDADLREHHAGSAQRAAIEAEWREAFEDKRTADTFDVFFGAAVDQAAVHWILALVFIRFLEDNRLIDQPIVAGPGERTEVAQLRQREYFRTRPQDSDAEYLVATFGEIARLPGLAGLYDPAHNPLFRLPVSGDGAIALFDFFRRRAQDSGDLQFEFSDPDWNTRFLGDLYQDLSEEARKRYALLQTPEFVESWILSRTLDPAIGEFGHEAVRIIDPTCGSGHFLLGGFERLLEEWRRHAPDMPPAAQAQRALDAVAGVDLNPFAVEIARFRLLIAALRAAGEMRLAAAPDFRFQLVIGDSLLHGRHFARRELGGADEGFRRVLRHHYVAEDTGALDAILGRQYHAVVGNPPYITPKDPAIRDAYREIYQSCHMKYGLGAPFTERFFDLALDGTREHPAGFVGLIVANSFMKREFGKKLIEEVLPSLDLTHVIDCSGAYIPGHGTPTVILLGRSRPPVASVVRTVRGVRGEPTAPADPALGQVWSSIVNQIDHVTSESDFISTEDTPRDNLRRHPWNMGGGGAADLQESIEKAGESTLMDEVEAVGFMAIPGEDEALTQNTSAWSKRYRLTEVVRNYVAGDDIRDWMSLAKGRVFFPFDSDGVFTRNRLIERHLWNMRTTLASTIYFGKNKAARGLEYYDYAIFVRGQDLKTKFLAFSEVTTNNHFYFARGNMVLNKTAPVIKLKEPATDDEYLGLLGLLNSSTACFWIKQVCHNKGDSTDVEGARTTGTDLWINTYQLNGTRVGHFPITIDRPISFATAINSDAQRFAMCLPAAVCATATPTRDVLETARAHADKLRAQIIALQEELDWHCYALYGLHENPPESTNPPPLRLGERAFEIVMARQMAAGDLKTTWFERHRSTPITDLPAHWPADYRTVVERRIALIESDPTIGLIERPEYKRRWSQAPWEDLEREALKDWLLDRFEGPRYWPPGEPRIVSTGALADAARRDPDFVSVAELYAARALADLGPLVAELVNPESVPFLAAVRYTETGLRKRADWEATWDKQRAEDAIDAKVAARREKFRAQAERRAQDQWQNAHPRRPGEDIQAYTTRMQTAVAPEVEKQMDKLVAEEQRRRKREEVGDIPVPPKYKNVDFQLQDFWRLRGGLDVPKERFVSFPHCGRDADPSLPVIWAGYDHLQRALAIASWYVERKDSDGWPAERLAPLLAGLLELVPWLRQWHNDIDPESGLRMGDYFSGYVEEEARPLGLTLDDLRSWAPPAPNRRTRRRRVAL